MHVQSKVKQIEMKNLLKQIKNLYRIETIYIQNNRIHYKSKAEIFMERMVHIVFTFGFAAMFAIILRFIFNF